MTSLKQSSTPIQNLSGLRPLGRAVLIEPYEPEISSSRIVMPDSFNISRMMVEVRGTVIAVGPEAWADEKVPRAQPGDKVLVSKWCGHLTRGTADDKIYRMVNADDVFCAIEEELIVKSQVNAEARHTGEFHHE